jgi:hypothetical protein
MHSCRAEGCGWLSLRTHYLRYLDIHPPDGMRITSYCDNCSLLNHKEDFRSRDSDSPSLDIKADHDIIMTLSSARTSLPIQLASLRVRGHQSVALISPPGPRNSMLSLIPWILMHKNY